MPRISSVDGGVAAPDVVKRGCVQKIAPFCFNSSPGSRQPPPARSALYLPPGPCPNPSPNLTHRGADHRVSCHEGGELLRRPAAGPLGPRRQDEEAQVRGRVVHGEPMAETEAPEASRGVAEGWGDAAGGASAACF